MSFSGRHIRIWAVGSSIVKHAFVRARSSYDGSDLGLQRYSASIWWQGRGGLRWCHLVRTIRHLLTLEDYLDLLLLHLGGNDLGQVRLGDLRFMISRLLFKLQYLLPATRFIWSQILPRLNWRSELNHAAMERARRRTNSFVASLILRNGGGYIRYPELSDQVVSFFRDDAVHLSDFANDIFLYRLQQGLQLLLTSKLSVSPATGEFGPWLAF